MSTPTPIPLAIDKVPSVESGTGIVTGIQSGYTPASQPVVNVIPLSENVIKDSDFWLQNPKVLIDPKKIFNLFPSANLPPRERLNAMVRLGGLVSFGIMVWKGSATYIIIFIVVAIYTLYLEKMSAAKERFFPETDGQRYVPGAARTRPASTVDSFKDLKTVPEPQYDGTTYRESMYSKPASQLIRNQVRRVDIPKPKTLFDELSEKPDMVTQTFTQETACDKDFGRGASNVVEGIDFSSLLRKLSDKPVARNQLYNSFSRNRIGGTTRGCQYFLKNKNINPLPISEMDQIQQIIQNRNNTTVNAFKQNNILDKESVFGTAVRFLGDKPATTSGRGSYVSNPNASTAPRSDMDPTTAGRLQSPNQILSNPNRTYY
jgi:hypothetical protein